jgi:hypothetical protein
MATPSAVPCLYSIPAGGVGVGWVVGSRDGVGGVRTGQVGGDNEDCAPLVLDGLVMALLVGLSEGEWSIGLLVGDVDDGCWMCAASHTFRETIEIFN